MSTYTMGDGERETGLWLKVFAIFAGVTIPAVLLIGLWMAVSAFQARDDARNAAASAHRLAAGTSMAGMAMPATSTAATTGAVASPSYAGIAPANADAIAMAHAAYPATLPAVTPGAVANVRLDIRHTTVSIAPGIKYKSWTSAAPLRGL